MRKNSRSMRGMGSKRERTIRVDDETPLDDFFKPKDLLNNRWEVENKISSGAFGQVYKVVDTNTGLKAALKAEMSEPLYKAQLPLELKIMKLLQGHTHAPQIYAAGVLNKRHNFIVMQLLGRSLNDLRRQCPEDNKRFSRSTSVRLAKQCLDAIKSVHKINFLHRDIKPSNYVMGLPDSSQKDVVFLLDYGLSRTFVDEKGHHRRERPTAGFRGTLKYASIASHKRKDLGRRDDLIMHFYMTYEFYVGQLPWRKLTTHEAVCESKEAHPISVMVKEIGEKEYIRYVDHLQSLKFDDKPDFELLINYCDKVMKRRKFDDSMDWDWDNEFKLLKEQDSSRNEEEDED
uniref:non-specific serine/threonine protein kinase n=1 Tax=Romanomermis culicivorax TaxID=13658 RepID=A0A915J8C6_ROMCU